MPDRKTVMSWLEGLTQDDWQSFHSDSEVQQIAMATLELLKEQEPRLLNYDEISNHDCVYMEFYGKKDIYPSLNYEAKTWAKEKYGKYWRVWSNNPTEDQRKLVKWE